MDWNRMFTTLKSVKEHCNDRRVIHRLYEEQLAVIICSRNLEEVEVRKGVQQGCALSPMIFNVYIVTSMVNHKLSSNFHTL
jgi:hypothetical protein